MDKKVNVDGDSCNVTEVSDPSLPQATAEEVRPEPAFAMSWREQAQRLQKEAHTFYFVFKHPGTRWYARLVAICVAGYLFSPVQLIPNYIPVIGVLDDLLIVFLGVKLLQKLTPADVLTECRERADAARTRRREEIRSKAVVFVSLVVAMLWLLAAVAASALMVNYFRH